jgi:hypothetical protein
MPAVIAAATARPKPLVISFVISFLPFRAASRFALWQRGVAACALSTPLIMSRGHKRSTRDMSKSDFLDRPYGDFVVRQIGAE